MFTSKLFSFALLFFFITCSYLSAQTNLYIRLNTSNGETAYIGDNYLNTHWPNHPDFLAATWTNGSPASARTLCRFDLGMIPEGSSITSAKLSLFANPSNNNANHEGPNETYLRRVVSPWDKDTVLWEPQPDYTHHHEVLLPMVAGTDNLIDIDVTDLIKDMTQNPGENYGFIFMQRFEYIYRSANFASITCPDSSVRPLLKITFDSPTPVELSSFSSTTDNRNITLRWTTATENNNSGFEVQRSPANDNSVWNKIGFLNGSGSSDSPHDYKFEDRNLTSGRYNYRLKQIDYNGNFKFYELATEAIVGIPLKFSLSQNYPNPFNPSTKINFDIPQDGKVILKVYDISGREIKTLLNEFKTAGYYSQLFDASNLSSGAYFYTLQAGDVVISKDMILVK
ncbi:MAG: DNRLRE domain-containing protein [Ignavibacteria bacterium]